MNDIIRPGWCCRPECGSQPGCSCVFAPGVLPELCLPCAAVHLGLPPDSGADAILAELERRTAEVGL